MQQVRIHGVDDVRVDEVHSPECGADDVLVDVVDCGICGSDVGYVAMGGLTPPGQPMPIGHELSGRIVQVGNNVVGWEVGARVVVNPTANGTDIGNGGPEGGFAPRLLVTGVATSPGALLALPDDVSFEQGALVEPLAVATHGVRQSGAEPGDKVAVLGAGPIGLCTVIALRHLGIDDIVVADLSAHRLGIAMALGAAAICAVGQDDLGESLRNQHGEFQHYGATVAGTDVFIEATGSTKALEQAIALAKPKATVTVVGLHQAPIEFHPLTLMMKELHLVGSMAYPDEFPDVVAMLASGTIDTSPLVTHRFGLGDFAEAFATARDTSLSGKVIVECDSVS